MGKGSWVADGVGKRYHESNAQRGAYLPSVARLFLIIAAVAATSTIAYWIGREPDRHHPPATLSRAPTDLPDYAACRAEIGRQRLALAAELMSGERRGALAAARRLLHRSLARDLTAHWLGTPWDFNGTSERPGEGQIACGYFVSTLLRDAGFEVDRVRLAQQPSGNIIRTLTRRENTTRLVDKPFREFLDALRQRGAGIYVIGLDRHVGLIAQTSAGDAAFIHSDGGANRCVVVEPVGSSPTLRRSRWREFANLSSDDELLEKWLTGAEFETVL